MTRGLVLREGEGDNQGRERVEWIAAAPSNNIGHQLVSSSWDESRPNQSG
jgi:hypothetical protein